MSMARTPPGTGMSRRRTKQEQCDAFIARLQERGDIDIGAAGFIEGICQHFEKLPTRYALDVNIDSLDVLSHKRLLDEARLDPTTISFAVRSVEVLHSRPRESSDGLPSPAFLEVRHSARPALAVHLLYQNSCQEHNQAVVVDFRLIRYAGFSKTRNYAAITQTAAAQASVWVLTKSAGKRINHS